jgi:hypothetical protein
LVPVYKVRFVRSDLTTVWCELTSSFSTKSLLEDDSFGSFDAKKALEQINNPRGLKNADVVAAEEDEEEEDEDEILICIRPTYEGKKVGEECRFVPRAKSVITTDEKSSSFATNSSSNGNSSDTSGRKRSVRDNSSQSKKQKSSRGSNDSGQDNINTAVASLLGLSSSHLQKK